MLIIASLFVALLCVECCSVKNDCVYPETVGHQADYYWRDYLGVIPKDAVVGGYSVDGNITYIAQTAHTSHVGMFPGTIYVGQKEGVTCPGQKYVDATHVKILCANPHKRFEWIQTTADENPLLIDYHWVVGGTQPSIVLYIGRVNFEGEVQVGRVYNTKSSSKGLWICNKAGTQINFLSYELLVFPR